MRGKHIVSLALASLMTVSMLSGCAGGSDDNAVNARSIIAGYEKDSSGIPVLTHTEKGGTYSYNGRRTAIWGVENDQWQTVGKNRANFHKYLEGSEYVNANTIALHSPWVVMEPEKDVYDFSDFDYYLEEARKAGFKLVIYFTSVNYAAGDTVTFTPKYILEDTETYSRVQMEELEGVTDKLPMCPADPDTLEREQKMIAKFFEHLKQVNTDGTILSVNIGSEVDFIHELPLAGTKNVDIRCHCANCEARYTPDKGNLEYMTEIFAQYTKGVIDAAASVYDLPIYTPVASLMYWPGGRFVEQPDYIKQVVNRANHVVCPSVAPTDHAATYRKEMDQFVAIEGNVAFASGIDTGWTSPFNNQLHLALAPWVTMFEYDGLGAIYWDHPDMSVTKTKGTREKLRTGWGPLRAAEYYISNVKGDSRVTTAWTYEKLEHEADLGSYHVKVTQEEDSNYGYGILVDSRELAFSATSYKEQPTTITVTASGAMKEYTFETGYYDADGNWVKSGTFEPQIDGKTVTFAINGDSGDYKSCVYRICAA